MPAKVQLVRGIGDALWGRFNADVDENCWYYPEMTTRLKQLLKIRHCVRREAVRALETAAEE